MGIDAIGFTLALLAMGLSLVAIIGRNLLIAIGASGLWASLMAFFLANTTAGEDWQVIFILSAIAFIMAMLLIGVGRGFANRRKDEQPSSSSITRNIMKQFRGSDYESSSKTETNLDYRNRVRKALNRNTTGKRRR